MFAFDTDKQQSLIKRVFNLKCASAKGKLRLIKRLLETRSNQVLTEMEADILFCEGA